MSDLRGWLVAALVAVLPFEPRRPLVHALGLRFTLLEAAAGVLVAALLWTGRARLLAALRRPPVAFLALFAVVNLLSAAASPHDPGAGARFALRPVAMAAAAVGVAAAGGAARRRGLWAAIPAALVVAVVAIAEASGVRALDPWLDAFREGPFNVAGARRATATTEYPNLAAAVLAGALVLAAAWSATRRQATAWSLGLAVPLVVAALATYSRGALGAAGVGLVVLAVLARRAALPLGPVVAAAGVLVAGSAAFASGVEVFRLRLGKDAARAWYGARYEPHETALRLAPGERRTTAVRVTNRGAKAWRRDEAFHLSYHWYRPRDERLTDGGRTALPRDLAPGDSAILDAEIEAPAEEGGYLLVWDMVHEHTTWFSGQGVRPAVASVTVATGGPSPATPAPRDLDAVPARQDFGWRPGRRELWTIALDMVRERPLLGFGPDAFRRVHGARAGREHWDRRVYANNTGLELAANTGVLGAAAFAASLATALAAAWRVAARAGGPHAAAVTAGLAVASAHGLVDYLLAFTGPYLSFAVLVGCAAALDEPT